MSEILLKKPGNSGSNRWIPASQSLKLSTSNQKCSYQELMGILLASWYPSLVLRLLCTTAGKWLPGIYPCYGCIAENRTVLCGLTLVILHFRPLWRCVLSYTGMILLALKHKTLWCAQQAEFLLQQMILYYKTLLLLHWAMMMLIFDVNATQNHR